MGLDAAVRCDCFERGLMKPCPVDISDIYIDNDGYLASRKLDKAYKTLDYRRYMARYSELEDAVREWAYTGCEHEDGEICTERIGNIAGCAHFRALVEEAGGREVFPLLSDFLPHGNGGLYPVEKAQATLDELDAFMQIVVNIDEWILYDVVTGEEIWHCTGHSAFPWIMAPSYEVGMTGNKVYIALPNRPLILTSHFQQIPIGEPDGAGRQKVRIHCLDTDEETLLSDGIGAAERKGETREFVVKEMRAPFLFEGKYSTVESLRRLLHASIATGNPIRWC